MTPKQQARYRVLRGYGLTRAQAMDALGLVDREVGERVVPAAAPAPAPAAPECRGEGRVLVFVDEVSPVPPRAWVSICERQVDPMACFRRGCGPVR